MDWYCLRIVFDQSLNKFYTGETSQEGKAASELNEAENFEKEWM